MSIKAPVSRSAISLVVSHTESYHRRTSLDRPSKAELESERAEPKGTKVLRKQETKESKLELVNY